MLSRAAILCVLALAIAAPFWPVQWSADAQGPRADESETNDTARPESDREARRAPRRETRPAPPRNDDVSAAPPAASLPQVILEERLPANWFARDSDRYPLRPDRWRRRMPRQCRTQGGYIDHCQGERRVAEASPEAQLRAERLGLGRRETARWLMNQRPLDEWMDAVAHLEPSSRLTFPVPGGHMGRGFGRVRRGSLRSRPHKGIDIGAPEGSTIVAAQDALVVYSDNRITGYGNSVMLLHAEGYSTFYAHCTETLVAAGEYVQRGQPIATVGDTGFAWAPHLHFEWRQRGWARDPARRLLPNDAPPLPRAVEITNANEE